MTNIVKVVLTFANPTKLEFLQLFNTIHNGKSLTEQKIYIASPQTNLLHYSDTRLDNITLLQELNIRGISPDLFVKFQNKQLK
jgi:hypothetical protein